MPRRDLQLPSTTWPRPRRSLAAILVVVATGASLLLALAVTFGFIAS